MSAYRSAINTLVTGNENAVYNLTGCLSLCDKSEYSIGQYTDLRVNQWGYKNILALNFFMPTTTHSVKEQYVIYDGNSFVADVGGYLGLLLGHSLLGIFKNAVGCTAGKIASKLQ